MVKTDVYQLYQNARLFYPNFGSYVDKPKRWVKNVIKNVTQWLGLSIYLSQSLVKTTHQFL